MRAVAGRGGLEAADLARLAALGINQDDLAGAAGGHHDLAQARREDEVVEADPPFAAGQRDGLGLQLGRRLPGLAQSSEIGGFEEGVNLRHPEDDSRRPAYDLAATRLLERLSANFTPRAPARVRHSPT